MSNKELTEIKMKQVEQYRQSGLSAQEWCRQSGMALSNLRYWITKINRMNKQLLHEGADFIEFTTKTVSSGNIAIVSGAFTINVSPGFDEELLLKVAEVLSRL